MSNNTVVSKPLLVALGVVVALALLFVFVVTPLLLGGDDTAELGLAPVPQPTEPGDDDPQVADAGDGDALNEGRRARDRSGRRDEPLDARDPFAQLVSDEVPVEPPAETTTATTTQTAAPAPGTTTTTADGTTTTTTSDGTTTTTAADGTTTTATDGTTTSTTTGTTDGTTTDPGAGSDPTAEEDTGDVVTLVELFRAKDGSRRAVVTVDDAGYTVAKGDTFAGEYQLLEFRGPCATFQYGDSRFTLRKGEAIQI